MTPGSPRFRRFARRALVQAAGAEPPDRAQLASAFEALCERLRTRLHPLFGGTAIEALFARALHVARSEFPWLAGVVPRQTQRCSLEGLDTVTADLQPGGIEEGLAAILGHQIGLLSAFIGEDLIVPLVQESWGGVAAEEFGEPSGEQ